MDVRLDSARATGDRRFYFVSGQAVELWEDPEMPFGWGVEEMSQYAAGGNWELLFNALVLSASLEEAEDR